MTKLDLENGVVELPQGSGGRGMHELLQGIFLAAFDHPTLHQGNDQAALDLPHTRIVMASDSHVINPLFFPGGNIGSLAVHGTVNDVVMSGARPLYMAVNFILEEGFALASLVKIVKSMAQAAREASIAIVTGDTKVVERGKADGVFISTTGIGALFAGMDCGADRIQAGDAIILSGSIGDHAVAVMAARQHLGFNTDLLSDSQSLHDLVAVMCESCPDIHCMRDPTRGGLAATLNELAHQTGVGMQISEDTIPVKPAVKAAGEFLGLDPLHLANEGKLVAFCPPERAEALAEAMRQHRKGKDAAVIGKVTGEHKGKVSMQTSFGGRRLVEWKFGDQLPRIC